MAMKNTKSAGLILLVLAIGLSGCSGTPSGPTHAPCTCAPPTPTVTAIAPPVGATAGATSVTITGTGFLPGAIVTIGAQATSVIVQSTKITATAPAHAGGIVNVVVTNPGGASGELDGGFIYAAEPFTVTPSVNSVAAEGQMSVSWTAPQGGMEHWIALFPVGGPYSDDWYGLTYGASSGMLTVTAPGVPGQYEFRYLNDRFVDLARSHPITVTPR